MAPPRYDARPELSRQAGRPGRGPTHAGWAVGLPQVGGAPRRGGRHTGAGACRPFRLPPAAACSRPSDTPACPYVTSYPGRLQPQLQARHQQHAALPRGGGRQLDGCRIVARAAAPEKAAGKAPAATQATDQAGKGRAGASGIGSGIKLENVSSGGGWWTADIAGAAGTARGQLLPCTFLLVESGCLLPRPAPCTGGHHVQEPAGAARHQLGGEEGRACGARGRQRRRQDHAAAGGRRVVVAWRAGLGSRLVCRHQAALVHRLVAANCSTRPWLCADRCLRCRRCPAAPRSSSAR